MTLPAPTLDALHEATLALAKVIDDARKSAGNFTVGQTLTGEQVKSLPVGAVIEDKDGDAFKVIEGGKLVWNYSNAESGLNPSEFEPHKLISLPAAPEPEPATPAVKVGDTVRIVSGFTMGRSSGVVGRVGKIREIEQNHMGTGRICYHVNGCTAAEVELVQASAAPASLPLTLLARHEDREVEITRAGPDVHFQVKETRSGQRVFAYLSRDHARTIAASLLAFADEDS